MSAEGKHEGWLRAVRGIPGVLEALTEDDHIVAVVATREDGLRARASARELRIPRDALRIRVMRYWLHPYPDDAAANEELLRQEMSEWAKEDEDL